ncbi:hypothetical protein MK489_00575 [Myxococcota bacterium]|nr:hypothetical protein [Myxococcota bacterium]
MAVFACFVFVLLLVYHAALQGPFVSDDYGYIVSSPYTQALDARSLIEIFDPFGQATRFTVNYAPVHLVATALERQMFADDVMGYHLVNVVVHALASVLLMALLLRSGVPTWGAAVGALIFALHPANVEAVAWISQLKTTLAMVWTLSALLTFERRPGLATGLFALGLLTKASAYAALPMAAAFCWVRPGTERRQWFWLAGWAALFVLYLLPEATSIAFGSVFSEPAYNDPWVHVRSMAAVGARYLVMAATSYGVSAFQEPVPTRSPWDPWWLAALVLGAVLLWRMLTTLYQRREEGAWWLFAAASFAPVSQIMPFVNPVADRYLYFILPGLIGGVLMAGGEGFRRMEQAGSGGRGHVPWSRFALVTGIGVAGLFGAHSMDRTQIWRSETRLVLDAALHYPEGGTASFLAARSAAQVGDVATAVMRLRAAEERHAARFTVLLTDPGLAPIRSAREFQALVREMAGRWIEKTRGVSDATQPELRVIALAHQVREEYPLAVSAMEKALVVGGPQDELVREELTLLRSKLRGAGR